MFADSLRDTGPVAPTRPESAGMGKGNALLEARSTPQRVA
jgi:hypothetical protein